jgi:hypothetical protein
VNGNYTYVHPRYPSPPVYRRPVPTGAEDIGTWLDILQITSVVSVITNAALVCYTMQLTSDYSDVGQLWIFIGFQYTIFVIMAIFAYVVDDCPEEVCATAGCVLRVWLDDCSVPAGRCTNCL